MQTSTIGLIGIDVDGTLVGSGGVIHPSVWDAVRRASESGIHLALCSGRPAFGLALEYARRLEAGGWHVFQNGASIVNLASSQSRSTPIPGPWITTLIAQARQRQEVLELYSDTTWVAESHSELAREHGALLGVGFTPQPFESLTQPIVRAQWLLSPASAMELKPEDYPGLEMAISTSPLMPETRFVGLTREGITKGTAMRGIAAEYGVSLENVMYVGDAGNDLSALRIVGHPIAMGNADPVVIQTAKHTVDDVDRGGLAQAIQIAVDLNAR